VALNTWYIFNGTLSQNSTYQLPSIAWRIVSQNPATLQSTVEIRNVVRSRSSTYDWNGTVFNYILTVNGVSIQPGSFTSNSYSGWTYSSIATDLNGVMAGTIGGNAIIRAEEIPEALTTAAHPRQFVITHNSDGTKQVTITGSYSLNSGGYGPGNVSFNTTITLDTIPVARLRPKVGGAWKTPTATYVKVNGVWKQANQSFVKVGGTWKTTS
jgi:hypothetical protein